MKNLFARAIRKHAGKELDVHSQQELGKPVETALGEEYVRFLRTVLEFIDTGKIDIKDPSSILHISVYEELDERVKGKVDLAIPNIITLLERIMDLHVRPEKDESFEMKNLIETLWQTKERIEREGDVFIF